MSVLKSAVRIVAFLALLTSASSAGTIYYVVSGGTGGQGGSAWDDACATISAAVTAAGNGDEIWVQAGTYPETVTLKNGISLYGGFAGAETARDQRDWVVNTTTINANGGGHCLYGYYLFNVTVDGFLLTNGQADYGGGLYAYSVVGLTVQHCTFRANNANGYGGGMYVWNTAYQVLDCTMENNTSGSHGGAMFTDNSTGYGARGQIIRRCLFRGNQSNGQITSGVFFQAWWGSAAAAALIEDCTFVHHQSNSWGGALRIHSGLNSQQVTVRRCLFADNHCDGGAAIRVDAAYSSTVTVEECRFIGNWPVDRGGSLYFAGSDDGNGICRAFNNLFAGEWDQNGYAPSILVDCNALTGSMIYHNTFLGNGGSNMQGCVAIQRGTVPLANNIFANNYQCGAVRKDVAGNLQLLTNLFYGNSSGDYWDRDTGSSYTGSEQLRLLPEADDNITGDPGYPAPLSGTSTSLQYLGASECQTELGDNTAPWIPGSLAGKLICPQQSSPRYYYEIISNTTDTLRVWGEMTRWASVGQTYMIYDYHQANHGYGIDRARPDYRPSTDIEGRVRPGGDGKADIGCLEYPDSYTGPEATLPPVSTVYNLPVAQGTTNLQVPWRAVDDQSSISYVELLYRKRGDAGWVQFGGHLSASPIPFVATRGSGWYDFYTLATNAAGLTEAQKTSADASSLVMVNFTAPAVMVDKDAVGTGDGASWANAITQLNTAVVLASAVQVPEVWVKAGTYAQQAQLLSGVSLYGGFGGDETSRSQRDWIANPTILDPNYNYYHVLAGHQIQDVTVDGFTITHGLANQDPAVNPTPNNRRGAGVYLEDSDNVTIENCHLHDNQSRDSGAAIGNVNTALELKNCSIDKNTSSEGTGGGLYSYYYPFTGSMPTPTPKCVTIENCGFYENMAPGGGGINIDHEYMPGDGYSAIIRDSTFSDNNKPESPGQWGCGVLVYCHSWASSTATRALVERNVVSGGYSYAWGGGIIVNVPDNSGYGEVRFNDFIGNFSAGWGGGALTYGWIHFHHNLVVGNRCNGRGGGVYLYEPFYPLEAEFNTVAYNQAAEWGGGFSSCYGDHVLRNNVIVNNTRYACAKYTDVVPEFYYNFFNANTLGVFYDIDTTLALSTVADLNAQDFAAHNLAGDPLFVTVPASGTATQVTYFSDRFSSEIQDSHATWTPGALAGLYVAPNWGNSWRTFKILSNTEHAFTILGFARRSDINCAVGSVYKFFDFHEQCLGRGYPSNGPLVDSADPGSPYNNEPAGHNGGRANLGRYGNTADAGGSDPATQTPTATITPTITITPTASPTGTPIPSVTTTPTPTEQTEFYVESRSGGKNYSFYSEEGTWANGTSKSTAPGTTTTGIGSRNAATDVAGRTARFTLPDTAPPGMYGVYITWARASNRASHAEVWLDHDAGRDVSYHDQTKLGNTWHTVGTDLFQLHPGRYVEITTTNAIPSASTTYVIADAVWFSRVGPTEFPTKTPTAVATATPTASPPSALGISDQVWQLLH